MENKPEGMASSSEEEDSDEESSEEDEALARSGMLPPNSDDEDDNDELLNAGLKNLNTSAPKPSADAAPPGPSILRTGKALTAEEIAEARKAKKTAKQKSVKVAAPGDDSESEVEEAEENANRGKKTIKVSELGNREMSRRERYVCLLPWVMSSTRRRSGQSLAPSHLVRDLVRASHF
jgi:hypothetical protein